MLETAPQIESIIMQMDASDEVDYYVNSFLAQDRGIGLTACQPALVNLAGVGQAIRFKIDSTFLDNETNKVKGYGILDSDEGFVGEIYMSYNEADPENMDIIYISPQEEIDARIQEIMANSEKYIPSERPRGKY